MEIMQTVAGLMALSARTAPKAKGQDYLEIKMISDKKEINQLADEMINYSEESGKKFFKRDAENIRKSGSVLLISLKDSKPAGLNCGACGVSKCSMLQPSEGSEFAGPLCAWRLIDLGIALGSAAKTAGILNADNRIMYSPGVAARRLGLIQGDIVVAIPISGEGKNIYFDRPTIS
ncbi:MAG: DUF2148 domain-containing protein [Eubacteriales bacterium]